MAVVDGVVAGPEARCAIVCDLGAAEPQGRRTEALRAAAIVSGEPTDALQHQGCWSQVRHHWSEPRSGNPSWATPEKWRLRARYTCCARATVLQMTATQPPPAKATLSRR